MKYIYSFLLISIIIVSCQNNNSENRPIETFEEIENTIRYSEALDVCRCLIEPSNNDYMVNYKTLCIDTISSIVGVEDYTKAIFTHNDKASRKFDSIKIECGLMAKIFTQEDVNIFAKEHFEGIDSAILKNDTINFGGNRIYTYLTAMNNNQPEEDGNIYLCISYIGIKSSQNELSILMAYCKPKHIIIKYWEQPVNTLRALIDQKI